MTRSISVSAVILAVIAVSARGQQPEDPAARLGQTFAKAYALRAEERYHEAVELLQAELPTVYANGRPSTHLLLAMLLNDIGEVSDAWRHLAEANKSPGQHGRGLEDVRALMALRAGLLEVAEKAHNDAAALQPSPPRDLTNALMLAMAKMMQWP